MGPKRIYLLSLSPEREKILPVALGSPCLRHKAAQSSTSAAAGASEAGEQEMSPRAKDT